MRPPICEVCGREAVATASFRDYEPLPDGMTGHPRGLGWFCGWHLGLARRLSRRTLGEAVRALRLVTALALAGVVTVFVIVGMIVFT